MRCSRDGQRFRSIAALARHYRKAHPSVLKRARKRIPQFAREIHAGHGRRMAICPLCQLKELLERHAHG